MENITVKDIAEAVGGKVIAGDLSKSISGVCIDSRIAKTGDIFVPIIGERADGHDYIGKAIENGASAVFTSRDEEPFGEAAWIKVDDTLKALISLGVYCKSRYPMPVVCVTGSVGKTTTREMVATALGAGFKVFKTAKNFNSNIGLPITLTEMKKDDEIAVLELGISDFNEMSELTDIARPDVAVITNIGVAHIAQLKTRDNICKEKLKITEKLNPEGVLILNGDNDMLRKYGRDAFKNVLFYGIGNDNDVYAENIEYSAEGTEFEAVFADETVKVVLPVIGEHMVMNALAALCAAKHFGISLNAAAKELAGFEGFKNRQQVYDIKKVTVIDDTYNASPDSMRAAISVLDSMKAKGRKTAVLADMLELGDDSSRFHREIGEFASEHLIDRLITIGDMSQNILDGFVQKEENQIKAVNYKTNKEAYEELKKCMADGDLILFKGSNGMHLGEIIEWMKEGR